MKYDPRKELCDGKEKHHVDAEQPAKVPGLRIHDICIREKSQAAGHEQSGTHAIGRRLETRAHESITTGFQQGRHEK